MSQPPYSPAALESLIGALERINLADHVTAEAVEDYGQQEAERSVTHHVLRKVFAATLGPDLGGGADWVNPTWHLGRGRALRDSGEPYLFEGDYDDEYMVLLQIVDEDEGSTEVEEVTRLKGKDALLRWAKKTLKDVQARKNPELAEGTLTLKDADHVLRLLGLKLETADKVEFLHGLEVEAEHLATVGGDWEAVGHIVLDHLREDRNYYRNLKKAMREHYDEMAERSAWQEAHEAGRARYNPSVKISDAALNALDVYVTDPAHVEQDAFDDEGAVAAAQQILESLKGHTLTTPDASEPERCWAWHARLSYAAESAMESDDHGAAKSLNALASKCIDPLRKQEAAMKTRHNPSADRAAFSIIMGPRKGMKERIASFALRLSDEDLKTVDRTFGSQGPAIWGYWVRAMDARKKAGMSVPAWMEADTRENPHDLRSPAEKAFGLQAGEAYGADEVVDTDIGHAKIFGHKVEFAQNENTSYITGWVKGIGTVGGGYSLEEAKAAAREKLAALRKNPRRNSEAEDSGTLHERVAKALGWSVRDTQSMSLASLRDLVRPVSMKLANELSAQIQSGGHIKQRKNPRRKPEEHRIYVANLAAYNAGRLKGQWIEPSTDPDELAEQIVAAIGGNPDHEWAIHDYDSFPDMGEHPDLKDVSRMAEILEQHPLHIVQAAQQFASDDMDELEEWLEEGYGTYESERDYVEQYVDDAGGPSALGKKTVDMYFDYDSFGHDVLLEADEEDRERFEGMSDQEVGETVIDEIYGDKIPNELADRYFDYDSFARDVFMEVASVRVPGEGLVVFSKR